MSNLGLGDICVYGGRFFTPDDGKRLAKIRAEELLARQVVHRGTGTAFYLRTGYFFTLEDHPRSDFNQDYLVTDVEHIGNQSISDPALRALAGIDTDKVYTVAVKAIPSKVQFRPESMTAWPRIYGSENGTICGPADSDYAQIDDQGRYNVKFKFDESDLKNGKASTFVRMMQPHGGNPEGFHFPLRKGTEVIFTFLGGDPDRPVICGRRARHDQPEPGHELATTRRTSSTPGATTTSSSRTRRASSGSRCRHRTPRPISYGQPEGRSRVHRAHRGQLAAPHRSEPRPVCRRNCTINVVVNHTEAIGGIVVQTVTGDVKEEHKSNHDWEIGGNEKKVTIGNVEEMTIGSKKDTVIGSTTRGPRRLRDVDQGLVLHRDHGRRHDRDARRPQDRADGCQPD